MSGMRYTNDHEWARQISDDVVEVGITDFAQEQLGDIIFVELPEIDSIVDAHDEIAVIDSVKAAADVKSPVSGTVVEVNENLEDQPELVNESPTDDGWFCKIQVSDIAELDDLMSEPEYEEFVSSQS